MGFTVSNFKSNIASNGGGARPSLFKVKISNSVNTALSFTSDEAILVKAAQIPGSTIAALPINYVGRPIKYAGFRTFDNWTTTIINDDDFSMRNKVMEWMRVISGQLDGERNDKYGSYATAAGTYFEGQATVTQVNKDGEDGQSYTIDNIWPTNLGEIALGWENDAIEEYSVEWCYDTWKSN
jgi:hypothetical protein